MTIVNGKKYRVRDEHPYHPGCVGIVEYAGAGPDRTVVVLRTTDNRGLLFAVGSTDLVECDAKQT